jgi:hypothetical protein
MAGQHEKVDGAGRQNGPAGNDQILLHRMHKKNTLIFIQKMSLPFGFLSTHQYITETKGCP